MKLCLALLAIGCCLCCTSARAEPLPLLGVARVSIRVSNLDQARAFYSGLAGFKEIHDVTNADGSVASAYFKINDDQFLEIIPGLEASQLRPMIGLAIRTDQLNKLRRMLASLDLNPGEIRTDPDGDTGFALTNLPGQNVDFLEFVQYGQQSLAARTIGRYLDVRRLSTHLEHVGIITTNFDDAYNFYVKTLGFHETYRRVSTDRSGVVLDHIEMPGPSGDFVELMNQGQTRNPLTRKRGGGMAHFALTVPNEKALIAEAHARAPNMRLVKAAYGLDNRWNFNLFDPDGTRMEFMQVVDPAHPTPAVVVTPTNWPNNRSPAQ